MTSQTCLDTFDPMCIWQKTVKLSRLWQREDAFDKATVSGLYLVIEMVLRPVRLDQATRWLFLGP
jgi:hypothetical protein